ncbi:response regulator [Microvirga rosea]|uniref:response regulator n=1 Tax=Microvirga rosea TaxID=2715425 RepID=UPI001D0AD6C6|nr:response regulator [Microvirga rosea]MCB8822993.1 response regulator [Microvirga rosea]
MAVVMGETELALILAMALSAVALGSILLMGWRIAKLTRVQNRLRDQLGRRVTVFEQDAEKSDRHEERGQSPRKKSQAVLNEGYASSVHRVDIFRHIGDSIVNDLNNRLMVISANIDAVSRRMRDQPNLQRKLLSALVAVDQAAGLVERSSAFIRNNGPQVQTFCIAERVSAATMLLGRVLLRDDVKLESNVEDNLWHVQADPNDLELAIIALCLMLRDNLSQGGTLTLEAQNVDVSKGTTSGANLEGDFVRITIAASSLGNGPGASQVDGDSIFTMQDMDLASWLEFNSFFYFLQPLGGTAEVTTRGEQTVVAIYLPRAVASIQTPCSARQDERHAEERVADHKDILIFDPEIEVALASQAMLEEIGYAVRTATRPDQLMRALKAKTPDLLLLDVAMTGAKNGVRLAHDVRQILPDLPILLISGDTSAAVNEFPLLYKPIVSRELQTAIEKQIASMSGKVVSLSSRRSRRSQ